MWGYDIIGTRSTIQSDECLKIQEYLHRYLYQVSWHGMIGQIKNIRKYQSLLLLLLWIYMLWVVIFGPLMTSVWKQNAKKNRQNSSSVPSPILPPHAITRLGRSPSNWISALGTGVSDKKQCWLCYEGQYRSASARTHTRPVLYKILRAFLSFLSVCLSSCL